MSPELERLNELLLSLEANLVALRELRDRFIRMEATISGLDRRVAALETRMQKLDGEEA